MNQFPHINKITTIVIALIISVAMQAQNKITLLHTNDLHSSVLERKINTTGTGTVGGFARIATLIKEEKKQTDHPVLVVDAGDFLMGTLFQTLEIESGFQLHLMEQMGYDAVSIGNHEFDFGVGPFTDYVRLASNRGCPPLLLSNIDHAQAPISALYNDSIIREYHVIEKEGIKIGLFGLLGDIAYEYTPNLHPFEQKNRVKTAKKMVNILREQEMVDVVICLSHSGVYKDKKGEWLVSEDVEIAEKVEGIDAIISGHTHTLLKEPLVVNNTPIVQVSAQGQYLGKLTLYLDAPGKTAYELIPVTHSINPDPFIKTQVDTQYTILKTNLVVNAGIQYDKSYFENPFALTYMDDLPDETSIGKFIADAMYFAVNHYDSAGTDAALIAQGMIRKGLEPGIQQLPSVFQVASLGEGNDQLPGYPLARLYFTGKEMKKVLELLHVVSAKDPGYYCFASGIEINYKAKGGFLNKIEEIMIYDEEGMTESIDFSKKNRKLYSVTADSYMMQILTVLKKKSFGLVNVKPKMANGQRVTGFSETLIDFDPNKAGIQEGKVWRSMLQYAQTFEDTDQNGIPEVPIKYKR